MKFARRLARPDLFLLLAWAVVIVRLVWPAAAPPPVGAILMAAFLLAAVTRVHRRTLILCSILGTLALVLAAVTREWWRLVLALDGAVSFAAFFGTILVLRATADRRPETGTARDLFKTITPAQQSSAFLIGAHLIGAVLVVGALAVLAPIQDKDASDAERLAAAESSQRGLCLAPLWSPFWIAMAVVYQYLPAVPLWQVLATGLPLAVLGLMLAQLMFARGMGLKRLWQATAGLAPIIPPVAICAVVIAVVASFTTLSTLDAVIACTPVLCAAAILMTSRTALVSAVGAVYRGIGGVSDEVALVTLSLALGRVLEKALGDAGVPGMITALQLPHESYIVLLTVIVAATSLIGIHQIVSITVLLVLLVPLSGGVAGVITMQSALLGWTFASMVGITAVSVAGASAMFRVPMPQLSYGENLKFVVVYGTAALTCLVLLN
ncbi:MAG: hypothetical protein AB7G35_19210, partial [Hyphomicrobiaceae bacterium]